MRGKAVESFAKVSVSFDGAAITDQGDRAGLVVLDVAELCEFHMVVGVVGELKRRPKGQAKEHSHAYPNASYAYPS